TRCNARRTSTRCSRATIRSPRSCTSGVSPTAESVVRSRQQLHPGAFMAADLQGVVTKVKKHVPIGVKRRVRRAVPARYRRLWDPDWHRGTVRGTKAHWDDLGKLQLSYLKEQGLQPEHYLLDVG